MAKPEACELWLGFVNSCVYYVYQTRDIYQVLPYSVELWNPLSKCSFIWIKGPINISNGSKIQK